MSIRRFQLMINLDNDAMQSLEDIAQALLGVSERLERGRSEGTIRDSNGNTVGGFSVTKATR